MLKFLPKKHIYRVLRLRAFSLLEIVVVIAITSTLMGLGIASLVSLRDRNIIRQGVNEFVQTFETVRNSARNSEITRAAGASEAQIINIINNTDYYALQINNNNYYKFICQDYSNLTTPVVCQLNNNGIKSELSTNILIIPLESYDESTGVLVESVSTAAKCEFAIFNLSTGNFRFAEDKTAVTSGTPMEFKTYGGAPCYYRFKLNGNETIDSIVKVDRLSNKIEILR